MPALSPDGAGECVGVLARQGAFEFVLTCGPFGMSRPAFKRAWLRAAARIKAASAEERAAAIIRPSGAGTSNERPGDRSNA